MKKKRNSSSIWPAVKQIIPLMGLFIAVCVVVGLGYMVNEYFKVKTVHCTLLEQQACSEQLNTTLQQTLVGQPFFFKNYLEVLESSPQITEPVTLVSITKHLPHSLEVTFQQESPLYVIEHNDKRAVVSLTGKIFPHAAGSENTYLVVKTQQDLSEGGSIRPDIHHTLSSTLSAMQELNLPIQGITWVDKSTIRLSMNDRAIEAVIDSEHPTLELHRLSVLLKSREYQELAEPIKEIDLRFTMPVLRT